MVGMYKQQVQVHEDRASKKGQTFNSPRCLYSPQVLSERGILPLQLFWTSYVLDATVTRSGRNQLNMQVEYEGDRVGGNLSCKIL